MVVLSAKGAEAERVAVEDVGHGRRRLFLVPCAAERGAWTQPVQHRHPIAAAPSRMNGGTGWSLSRLPGVAVGMENVVLSTMGVAGGVGVGKVR
jgi:hypothetical protein